MGTDNTHERITSRFNRQSTALELIEGIDLRGRRVIVTGGASGLGLETSRALAKAGASLTLAVRNAAQGTSTRCTQKTASPPTRCTPAAS